MPGTGSDINYTAIGERIRECRTARQMTQEVLADALGVAPEYLSRIENGKAQVNLKRLAELSELLQTPIEYFVAGTVRGGSYCTQEIAQAAADLTPRQREHVLKIVQELRAMCAGE